MARGNGGDRLHRRKWRGAPRRGRSAGALPRRRLLKRERNRARGRANGYGGEETPPAPDITPCPRLTAVVPRWRAVVPLGAVVPLATSGSTASATTRLLDQRLTLQKNESKGKRRRRPTRQHTHKQRTRNHSNKNNHTKQSELWPLSREGGGRSHLCLSQLVWHREELSLGP